ncbi:MAG: epoxide hydrolase [Pelagibacterales bacterium]|nr:epoxide hydrolase [Pelagibacterales bacterium]
MIKPFKVNVPNSTLDNIYNKVRKYPWEDISKLEGWEHGTNFKYLKEISQYWINDFSWKNYENKINKFSNFKTKVENINIHFIQEKGSGSKPTPLLILHGWPGSVIEFFNIIEQLAHPERFGGKEEDAFDVIVPSLPGFGFSDSPKTPMGPRKIANVLNKLMTENLGYKNYISQGGDWGATISNWLGYDHPKTCKAIHINCLTMRHPEGPQTKEEKEWQNKFEEDQIMQNGYRIQQATKPQTLSYGMIDSPVGIAAWIIEKFYFWSDLENNEIESVYSRDVLLANIMVYIITKTFNTASWIYYGRREEGGRFFPKNFKKIKIPTAVAIFPKEMSEWPPKSYVDRLFNIKRWTLMKKGGHFAAMEQPELLINDIIDFSRMLR